MGTCTCGVKPEEHISKEVLSIHHYWYMHDGFVEGCTYCETANPKIVQSDFASVSEQQCEHNVGEEIGVNLFKCTVCGKTVRI